MDISFLEHELHEFQANCTKEFLVFHFRSGNAYSLKRGLFKKAESESVRMNATSASSSAFVI